MVQSKSEVQVGSLQCGVVGNGLGRCSMFMFFLAGAIVLDLWLKMEKLKLFFPRKFGEARRPHQGKPTVNKPSARPYFLGGS